VTPRDTGEGPKTQEDARKSEGNRVILKNMENVKKKKKLLEGGTTVISNSCHLGSKQVCRSCRRRKSKGRGGLNVAKERGEEARRVGREKAQYKNRETVKTHDKCGTKEDHAQIGKRECKGVREVDSNAARGQETG